MEYLLLKWMHILSATLMFGTGLGTAFYKWTTDRSGWPLAHGWVAWAIGLYLLAGACWLPVVWQQIEMLRLSRLSAASDQPLPERYWRLCRYWMVLGVIAFSAMVAVYGLMVFKPEAAVFAVLFE